MDKEQTALYFTTVVAIKKDMALFGGHLKSEETEPNITRFMIYLGDGRWEHFGDMNDIVYAATKKPISYESPYGKAALLGRMGLYREQEIVRGGASGASDTIQLSREGAGYFLSLKYIGNHLYACGGQRIVYCQVGKEWVRMDQGAFVPISEDPRQKYVSFKAIGGFSEEDIYAVGWPHEIWHWDGKSWTQLDSPTNYPLYCVLCSKSGDVYIGGSNGLLFKGDRHKGWTDLSDHSITKGVLEKMTEFQGSIYVTAEDKLVYTNGGPIQEVVILKGDTGYCAIDSMEQELWCAGDEYVLQFDGKNWQRHICPENV